LGFIEEFDEKRLEYRNGPADEDHPPPLRVLKRSALKDRLHRLRQKL
jgi:hypothetical protein